MFRRNGNRNAVAGCFFHEQPLCIQKCGALADILHAGDGADEVGACKLAGDGLQLRCGIKMRGDLPLKKVTSSHTKGETVIIAGDDLTDEAIRAAIGGTGYTVVSVTRAPYEKRGSFARLFGK